MRAVVMYLYMIAVVFMTTCLDLQPCRPMLDFGFLHLPDHQPWIAIWLWLGCQRVDKTGTPDGVRAAVLQILYMMGGVGRPSI